MLKITHEIRCKKSNALGLGVTNTKQINCKSDICIWCVWHCGCVRIKNTGSIRLFESFSFRHQWKILRQVSLCKLHCLENYFRLFPSRFRSNPVRLKQRKVKNSYKIATDRNMLEEVGCSWSLAFQPCFRGLCNRPGAVFYTKLLKYEIQNITQVQQ